MLALLFLLAAGFPSTSKTSWMEPAAFHLRVGMSEEQALAALRKHGWKPERGKGDGDHVVAYEEGRSVTVTSRRGRVTSIRFELVGFIPAVREASEERSKVLRRELGPPVEKARGTTLLWDQRTPNVIAVVSTDPSTSYGKQGLGLFVVRYFDPPVE